MLKELNRGGFFKPHTDARFIYDEISPPEHLMAGMINHWKFVFYGLNINLVQYDQIKTKMAVGIFWTRGSRLKKKTEDQSSSELSEKNSLQNISWGRLRVH